MVICLTLSVCIARASKVITARCQHGIYRFAEIRCRTDSGAAARANGEERFGFPIVPDGKSRRCIAGSELC
jgi:hypothetical protein